MAGSIFGRFLGFCVGGFVGFANGSSPEEGDGGEVSVVDGVSVSPNRLVLILLNSTTGGDSGDVSLSETVCSMELEIIIGASEVDLFCATVSMLGSACCVH